ncbi:MAG: PBP1A family penicillin-binding protein [Gemmatimonadota bacterium]|nr:PBP1A family penicillin-binding protein [Gemmatimonadota bacterium]MEC7845863.1 PBP1A family penicillin-binding protein [Gemmatimonadota bacterium]
MSVIKILVDPRVLVLSTVLFLGLGAGAAWGTWQNVCADCPSIAEIRTFEPQQASKLYSHDGRLLAELGIESRTPVSINALPEYVSQAFVAVEDKRFYSHSGIDLRGFTRAVVGVLTGQSGTGGGSTITQQLARNMFETSVDARIRSGWGVVVRKIKELQVAFALERAYTKDQILEAYINEINYAHGWYGIQTASRNYFGKNATGLNPAEAALLAGIINLPEYYSPIRNPENAERRRRLVLRRMVDQGIIPSADFERYANAPIPTERAVDGGTIAPYFVEHVRQILQDRFGSQLYTAGYNIYTTLDLRMQRAAEKSMEDGWDGIEARPGFRHITYQAYQDSLAAGVVLPDSVKYVEGLFVALDPWTGSIRAMIGGRDFGISKFNRATQALRQAGSGFKPFVYTAAINSRIPPTYVVLDGPFMVPQLDGTEWRPSNYDREFLGPMTIRTGLMKSQNMIAIKLADEIGLESVAQTARRMGIRSEIERYHSTAIGAVEVIPLQMAEAYSTFANLGTKVKPFPILRVEDAAGRILWDPQPERTEVLDPLVARIMISMLEGVVAGGTGYNAIRYEYGPVALPYEVAAGGKTGTTNDGTDIWFNGFTPNLLATVWFGMDLPQEIWPNATGAGAPAPVWGNFLKRVYYGDPDALDPELREPVIPIPEPWAISDGLVTRLIDASTGKLASQWCPQDEQRLEMFLPGTEPMEYCDRDDFGLFRAPPN